MPVRLASVSRASDAPDQRVSLDGGAQLRIGERMERELLHIDHNSLVS